MPQMMPMMWLYMMVFVVSLMFVTISIMYFFCPPSIHKCKPTSMKKFNWNWKW